MALDSAKAKEFKELQAALKSGNITQRQLTRYNYLGKVGGVSGFKPATMPTSGTDQGGNAPGSSTSQPLTQNQADPFPNTGGKTQDALEAGLDAGKVAQQGSILGQNANVEGPTGGQTVTVDPVTGQATVKQSLSADQQAILDMGSKLTQQGQQKASDIIGNYKPYEADTSGMGGYQADTSKMPGTYKADTSGMGNFSFDSSDAGRQRVEEATMARLSRGLDQRQKSQSEDLAQSLFNRGIQFSNDPNSRYQQEMQQMKQDQQAERQSYEQQAVEMGGQEMSRNYDIASGTYGTNLTGNQARNAASLGEHQQGVTDTQALEQMKLAAAQQTLAGAQAREATRLGGQQQQMSDAAALQGMGTGLLMPNLPTYQGAGMDVTQGAGIQQTQQQINQQAPLIKAQTKKLGVPTGGGGRSSSGSSGSSPFLAG